MEFEIGSEMRGGIGKLVRSVSQIYYSLFSMSDHSEIEKIGQHMLPNHMTRGGNLAGTTHSNGRIE